MKSVRMKLTLEEINALKKFFTDKDVFEKVNNSKDRDIIISFLLRIMKHSERLGGVNDDGRKHK